MGAIRCILAAGASALALVGASCVAPAGAATLPEMLTSDMTAAHEHHPHGVPTNYRWYNGPFQSPVAPVDYRSVTAWLQVYRCDTAGLDPDDVIEIRNVQTWELDAAGWHQYQTGSLAGAAYPENFQGSPVAANVVAISQTESWIKVRMSPQGYNIHLYPKARAPYDPSLIMAVVVLGEARIIAYGGSTQCTIMGMGADYWLTTTAAYPNVKGATLGRLKHIDGGWRAFSATVGSTTNAPPANLPASEIR